MRYTSVLLLAGIALVNAQSQRIAEGAGEITGVPAPGSTVDNPQIDLTLFRPFCLNDADCNSGNCVDGINDDPNENFPILNVQGLTNVFYCGAPIGEEACQTVADAAAANPNDLILEFQRIDGICNNLVPDRQLYGSREHLQLRRMNGVPFAVLSAESGAPDQVDSVRLISDTVIDQISSIPNQFGASTLLVYMGQFIDHDLTLIEFLPPSERIFLDGTPPLEASFFFDLSVVVPGSDPVLNPNAATAWADLSMVYGSDIETGLSLRDPQDFAKLDSIFRGGQEFLPRADDINAPGTGRFVETAMAPMIPGLFAAGDIRTNEQVMLASFHTLFMREHNRLVDEQIRAQSRVPRETLDLCPPGTSIDEVNASPDVEAACELIYQLARRVNIAQWQKLVFVEYFDSWHNNNQEIGGPNSLPDFVYNDTLSPDIDIFFSTVTYRFGHTGVVNYVARLDPEEGSAMDSIFLGNAFFNPNAVTVNGGADTLLNGAANQCHERRDSFIVSGIRNFLFGSIPDAPMDNMDLPSFNLERGRDHEVALYNDARIFYGLEPLTTFEQVVNAPGLPDQQCIADLLEQTFGEIDNCDPFACGLAEPATRGEMGELFFAAQDDQFQRIRDADRFHYLNADGPTPEQLELAGVSIQEIENFQMQFVLNRNTFPDNGNVFNPSPFQTDACCLSTGDVSNTPVCVRETGQNANFRRFELQSLPICDALDELDLLNFVAGTMNPQSFRPYSCSCRPVQDSSQMVLFNIIAQAVEQTAGGVASLASALSDEMTEASQVSPERFPMENMQLSTDSQGNAEVMIEILPTMDPENEPTAEEVVGIFERANRLSLLGENSLMSANNMNMVCINCSPLPGAAADNGAGNAAAGGAGGATLLGLSVPIGAAILAAIGLVVLTAIGCGVRYRMKQNELPNFTSGQEAV